MSRGLSLNLGCHQFHLCCTSWLWGLHSLHLDHYHLFSFLVNTPIFACSLFIIFNQASCKFKLEVVNMFKCMIVSSNSHNNIYMNINGIRWIYHFGEADCIKHVLCLGCQCEIMQYISRDIMIVTLGD